MTESKQRIGAVVLVHNVTELRRRDRALVSKDATIREIHHRVKNNLQTVSALLRLQSRRIEDPAASAAINEAVRRVASIALVHETLSAGVKDLVDFDEIIEKITLSAIELSARSGEIRFERIGESGPLPSMTATPLALVVTELVHNALEHGLAISGSQLSIETLRSGDQLTVSVSDDGAGLDPDFSLETNPNLGLQIVKTLTENELSGELKFIRLTQGTAVKINLVIPQK